MKAKVKATGEIVEVKSHYPKYGEQYEDIYTQRLYNRDELDFNLDSELNEVNFAKKQSVTIEGWVALDEFEVHLFNEKPERLDVDCWAVYPSDLGIKLPSDSFPDLKWESEPLAVTIQITEK